MEFLRGKWDGRGDKRRIMGVGHGGEEEEGRSSSPGNGVCTHDLSCIIALDAGCSVHCTLRSVWCAICSVKNIQPAG